MSRDKSYCIAEGGLGMKGGFVHRCLFVFKQKDTLTCLMPMRRKSGKREKIEDTEEEENIHLSYRALRTHTGVRSRACMMALAHGGRHIRREE